MGPPVSLLCAVLLATAPSEAPAGDSAQEAAPPGEEVDPSAASPVELIPKIEVRHLFTQAHDGSSLNTTTTRIDMGFFRRFLIRYELPVQVARNGATQASGFGDMKLTGVTLLTSGARQVSVVLVGVVLDTASQPPLGTGRQQLFFGGAGALKPYRWWLIYALAQEQLSVGSSGGRPDVNFLLVRLGNLVFGRSGEWLHVDLDTTVNFRDDKARLFGIAELGSLVIGRVGLFLRAGTQLIGERQLDYTLETGVRYLFRLGEGAARK